MTSEVTQADQWRKKPVVITAVQINTQQEAERHSGICTGGYGCKSKGAPDGAWPHIHTLEGDHTWTPGDWCITGVKGERYFCKPDIFAQTYEPAHRLAHRGGEVVAWMYDKPNDGRPYKYARLVGEERRLCAVQDGWTETALYAAPPTDAWQGIESAPVNTPVEIKVGSMTFLARLIPDGSMSDIDTTCDQWQAEIDGEHPPCWSAGCCWATNENDGTSLQPTAWRYPQALGGTP